MKHVAFLAAAVCLANAATALNAREWLLQDGQYYDLSSPRTPRDRSGHYEPAPELEDDACDRSRRDRKATRLRSGSSLSSKGGRLNGLAPKRPAPS